MRQTTPCFAFVHNVTYGLLTTGGQRSQILAMVETSNTKGPSQKPPSPPPAYAELDPSEQSASSSSRPQPPPQLRPSSPYHGDNYYGPTPLLAQQSHVLPYYDPRSSYSVAEAVARARWRFIGALFWAFVILSAASLIFGMEVEIQRRPWRGWRVVFGGNGDPWMDQ